MSPASIKELRKKELLQAAFEIVKRHGLPGVTVDRIAKRAGTSKGMVHHYFKDKQTLIQLTMRYAHAKRRAALLRRLRRAHTVSERLWAVLSVILDEQYLQSGFCKAWVSFKAESFSDPELFRLHKAIHRREQSNIAHALLPFMPRPEARNLAIGIKALVEGYRFRLAAVPPQDFDSRIAVNQVLAYLAGKLPDFDKSVTLSR